jgi:hypothetical protein
MVGAEEVAAGGAAAEGAAMLRNGYARLLYSACAVVRACYSAARHLMRVCARRRTVMHEMEKQIFGKGFRF